MALTLFTNPAVLRYVRRRLLAEFFARFTHLLPKYGLPNPDFELYTETLAEVLQRPDQFPAPLVNALFTVEDLAAPEKHPSVDPTAYDADATRLSEAIRLWLQRSTAETQPAQVSIPSPPETGSTNTPSPGTQHSWLPTLHSEPGLTNTPSLPAHEPPCASPSPLLEERAGERIPRNELSRFEPQNPPSAGAFSLPSSGGEGRGGEASVSRFMERRPLSTEPDGEQRASPGSPNSPTQILPSALCTLHSDGQRRPFPTETDPQQKAAPIAPPSPSPTTPSPVSSILNSDHPVKLPHLEPWPEPVDGAEVLNQIHDRFSLYLALCPGAGDAITLWTAHTHAVRAFHQTPRLNLHSPHANCGKTTTLEILATMVPRPFTTENMKPAVLFRVVDQQQPTLLLDELDTYLHPANELRGLLNAGHKRGACAYRCEGTGNTIRAFNAFAPAALAGIGPLPATLRTRSILIPLVSAKAGEIKTRFDPNNTETETILGRKLARWAKDNFDAIAACKPVLPAGAFNRLADNWRPLFAIAQIAGGDWPHRAANAFALLTAKPQEPTTSAFSFWPTSAPSSPPSAPSASSPPPSSIRWPPSPIAIGPPVTRP